MQAALANQRRPDHGWLYKRTDALRKGQNGSRDAYRMLSSKKSLKPHTSNTAGHDLRDLQKAH